MKHQMNLGHVMKHVQLAKKEGNSQYHNCLTCDVDYMFRPDKSPPNNSVANCKYY